MIVVSHGQAFGSKRSLLEWLSFFGEILDDWQFTKKEGLDIGLVLYVQV